MSIGADDEIRTRDPHLGKVMLYQLSHVRVCSPHPSEVGRLRNQELTLVFYRHPWRTPLFLHQEGQGTQDNGRPDQLPHREGLAKDCPGQASGDNGAQ